MNTDRLLAMTDGVIAVIITIMVLELKAPAGADLQALHDSWPVFLAYVLSFLYIAIYWNNHHHYFHLVRKVNGAVLWANFHLLFWLSLVPFSTAWMGEHLFAPLPTALYGVSLLMPALAWVVMQRTIFRAEGGHSALQPVLGRDLKATISPLLYAAGIGLSFVASWAALLCYSAVALIWLMPDRRIEQVAERS
ncbi:MAG TPA: TMEM175 family protein [Rhizomicrobium sp.]|nr:TMEM175 family protein [Rhizomicrobium sp.]